MYIQNKISNIDHKRWSEKMSPLMGPHKKFSYGNTTQRMDYVLIFTSVFQQVLEIGRLCMLFFLRNSKTRHGPFHVVIQLSKK